MYAVRKLGFLLLVLAGVSIALSGCGRTGKLEEPPSSARIIETDEQGRPIKRDEETVEDNPFILDSLI